MKNQIIIYIFLSLLFGGLCYVSSTSLINAAIVTSISLLYFFLFAYSKVKKYYRGYQLYSSCFYFINNFIITLSIKYSTSGALESIVPNMDKEFQNELQDLDHLDDIEKLKYLKNYFHFHIYELFLNIVELYEEEGGNVIDMASYLLEEARSQEEYLSACKSLGIHKIVDFVVLWAFSFIILVLLRFTLSNYFSFIASKTLYQVLILVLFLFVLISIEMLLRKVFVIDVKGGKNV